MLALGSIRQKTHKGTAPRRVLDTDSGVCAFVGEERDPIRGGRRDAVGHEFAVALFQGNFYLYESETTSIEVHSGSESLLPGIWRGLRFPNFGSRDHGMQPL